MEWGQFQQSHGSQLSKIPERYWGALHQKLSSEIYDAGAHFTMSPSSDGWKVLVTSQDGLSKDDPSMLFLVDHAWTFQLSTIIPLLKTVPGLANRMAALMNIIKLPMPNEESSDSYDADSEIGSEAESSDSSSIEPPIIDQSDISFVSPSPITLNTLDGCSSGDLGDVSHVDATEHAQKSSHSSSGTGTPTQPFSERYKIAQLAEEIKEININMQTNDKSSPSSNQVIQEEPSNEIVGKVTKAMWCYSHAYHINNSPLPVWYIMDEFGSCIRQSECPTVAMTVFFYIPAQLAFTVFWPLADLSYGDEVTCDFVPECVGEGLERWCHTLPWSGDDYCDEGNPLWKQLDNFNPPVLKERCDEDFSTQLMFSPPQKAIYTVHTDIKVVQSHLSIPEFQVGATQEGADILWLAEHFKEFRSLKPHQFINQFPCENVVTCKDLLIETAKRANQIGVIPSWLPVTFNLLYEVPKLVKCFAEQEAKGECNVWIVKPWNLGRGLGITVTDNLHQIIRLAQVGPKIASRYISSPVLFNRDDVGWVKFDVRYIVLLKCVSPIELYVYDVFWLRFANKPFSLEDFHDYDKHFTVMNYSDEGTKLKQIHDSDFIPLFESMYPHTSWSSVQTKMYRVIRELFLAAVNGEPPSAIAPCAQARALYGLDLMLEWRDNAMEPQLLEVNYCPDCIRACKYHPQFYNHVFQTLFEVPGASPPVTRLL